MRLSPARIAFHTRTCRRNRLRRSFFQFVFFQSSLAVGLCLTMLSLCLCVLNALRQLRRILPESKEFRCLSSLPWGSTFPRTFDSFLFVPLVRLLCSFRYSHFSHWIPLTRAIVMSEHGGNVFPCGVFSNEVGGFYVAPRFLLGCFYRLSFTVRTPR